MFAQKKRADGEGLNFLGVEVGGEAQPRENFALGVMPQMRVLRDAKMAAKGVNPVHRFAEEIFLDLIIGAIGVTMTNLGDL